MSEVEDTPVADCRPHFNELFCVVCALPTSNPPSIFCSERCTDAWEKFLSGKWSWAQLYEWIFE